MTIQTTPQQMVTLVTQTRVMPDKDGEFSTWQQRVSSTVSGFPGFVDSTVLPPNPPAQVDWVIIQRFRSVEDGRHWIGSPEREALLKEIAPILVGSDDIHFFANEQPGPPAGSVSAVISTKVTPGHEQQFRAWQRRIAAAEAAFPGYQGTRVEPPVPGVQEDWATVVRFDSDTQLQAWLDSPQRQKLIGEAESFGAESHVRKVQGGFDNWFLVNQPPGTPPPPIWKQNMIVLLVLYPVVFLFGVWVSTPFLVKPGMPFYLALFIGNIVSVSLTGWWLIAWASRLLHWWLSPRKDAPPWTNAAGTALVIAIYAICLAIFSRFR